MNSERHFHIIQLNNKNIKIGNVKIKKESTPINAAKKLLNNLIKNDTLKLQKASILIKETTKGSTKKMYGPYLGNFQKNKLVEVKKDVKKNVKAKTKTSAKLKSNTKLIKMKGGFINNSKEITNISENLSNYHKRQSTMFSNKNDLYKQLSSNLNLDIKSTYKNEASRITGLKLLEQKKYGEYQKFFSCLLVDAILNLKLENNETLFLKKYEYKNIDITYLIRFLKHIQKKVQDKLPLIKKYLFLADKDEEIGILINDKEGGIKDFDFGYNDVSLILKSKDIIFSAFQDSELVADIHESLYFDHLIKHLILYIKNVLTNIYVNKQTTLKSGSCWGTDHYKIKLDRPENSPSWSIYKDYAVCVKTDKFLTNIQRFKKNNTQTFPNYVGFIKDKLVGKLVGKVVRKELNERLNFKKIEKIGELFKDVTNIGPPDYKDYNTIDSKIKNIRNTRSSKKYKKIFYKDDDNSIVEDVVINYHTYAEFLESEDGKLPIFIPVFRSLRYFDKDIYSIFRTRSRFTTTQTKGHKLTEYSNTSISKSNLANLFPGMYWSQYLTLQKANFTAEDWIFFNFLQTIGKKDKNLSERYPEKTPFYYMGKIKNEDIYENGTLKNKFKFSFNSDVYLGADGYLYIDFNKKYQFIYASEISEPIPILPNYGKKLIKSKRFFGYEFDYSGLMFGFFGGKKNKNKNKK